MTPPEPALGVLAWVLTYALHSTLLLTGAWLLTRREALCSPRLCERLWRTAALGGLVTASLQVGFGWQPRGGSWSLALPEPAALAAELDAGADGAAASRGALVVGSLERIGELRVDRRSPADSFGLTPLPAEPLATPDAPRAPLWAGLLLGLGLWAAAAALGLARLAAAALCLHDRLRGRRVLAHGPVRERFDGLGASSRVELAVCPSLASPITTGVWRLRVCLPLRALTDLGPAAQECMLAHELAHARRHDGAWLLGFLLLEALLPFQPLNRLARRRAADAAELLSDDWAAHRTGRSLDLARCLTQVATWVVGSERVVLTAPGMAGQASSLGRRVARLIEPARRPRLAGHGFVWTPLLALGLGAVALAAPGVGARAAEPDDFDLDDRVPAHAAEFPEPVRLLPAASRATGARQLAVLLELFTLLDRELTMLTSEFELLEREVRNAGLEAALADELARFGDRVAALHERRDRARDLLLGRLERASREAPVSGVLGGS